MKVNFTTDKKTEASIDKRRCVNCGLCGKMCPAGAVEEYQKTVFCAFSDCGEGRGADAPVKYFLESKGYSLQTACSAGCPLGVVPQAVAAMIREGDELQAVRMIYENNPLPWTCAQICSEPCAEMCKRGELIDSPVNVRELERYLTEGRRPEKLRYRRKFEEKICVIGSGPAGLAAAWKLSEMGYETVILEKDDRPGGTLSWGISSFRLDRERMEEEVDRLLSPGIELRCGIEAGRDVTLEELLEGEFSACVIAAGLSEGIIPDVRGAEGEMVLDACSFLRGVNRNEEVKTGEKVLIIGDGPLAEDTAESLMRKGISHVWVTPRPEEAHEGAPEEEKREAVRGAVPKQIIREAGAVKAVEFIRTMYVEDDMGRKRLNEIKGSEFNLFCDTVIFALGRKSRAETIAKVETYPDGRIKTDEGGRTNKKNVFACGDITGETGSLAEAMASGKRAALQADAFLRGRSLERKRKAPLSAPDEETIYPANVPDIIPQEPERAFKNGRNMKISPSEDISHVLKAVGIEGDMAFSSFGDKSREKGKGKRVAVAGGGMAGIAAAAALTKKGYEPVIFEKTSRLGGVYTHLSTERRVDKGLLEESLEKAQKAGMKVVYNAPVGIKPSFEELAEAGYDAVLMAIGETTGKKPALKNAASFGVMDIVSLMRKIVAEEEWSPAGGEVLVSGADEMVFDAARALVRRGKRVTVLAPCSRGGLQIITSAVNEALDEGIDIITGVEIIRINSKKGRVESVDCKVLETGRGMNIPCDTLVIGGTQRPDTEAMAVRNPGLDIDGQGYVMTDRTLATSIKSVFAIGDYAMSAADSGKAGAEAIDNYLSGNIKAVPVKANDRKSISVNHNILKGREPEILEGRGVFTEGQAVWEASRCMSCGYHRERKELCLGCGLCAALCPSGAADMVPAEEEFSKEDS